jgi:hypothetical protein
LANAIDITTNKPINAKRRVLIELSLIRSSYKKLSTESSASWDHRTATTRVNGTKVGG